MPSPRRDYQIVECWRSQQYGPLRDMPKDGWKLVSVLPGEDRRKVVMYWERSSTLRVRAAENRKS